MMCYYIYPRPLFQIFTQSIDAIDVTSVTLSCLNSVNAIDVNKVKHFKFDILHFTFYILNFTFNHYLVTSIALILLKRLRVTLVT